MVHSNKVLTVSYGTFSCTLEGFEDSFDTMKAIAEYFRDLAADDRYFGAEPPQPDAEMLARIAQREISRQVEARQEATGIVLRAADAAQAAPPPAPERAPEPFAEVAEVAEPEQAEVAVEPTPEPVAKSGPEAIAEPEAKPEVMAKAEAEAEPEVIAEPAAETIANAEPEPEADEPQAEIEDAPKAEAEDALEAEAIAEVEAEAEPVAAAEPIEAEPVEAEQPAAAAAPDSIAAKLQRIRAVVSRNEQIAAEEEDYSEDQHADAFVSEAASEITAALDIDEDDDTETDSDDEVDSILRAMDAIADSGEDAVEQDAVEEEQIALTSEIAPAQDQAEYEAAENEAPEYQAGQEAAPEAQAARILKVKRADFEAALAAGDIEEVSDEDEDKGENKDEDITSAPVRDSSLSPEEEADLLRELAEVEAEVEASHSADDDADLDSDDDDAELDDDAGEPGENLFAADDEEEEAPASPARAAQSLASETEQDDLSRLMDTADKKLGDPESSSNRDAYSQLRAAVAAAEAERSAGGTVSSQTDDDPYREDLANVVRPRRPVTTEIRPRRRDAASKPAPLKLVAEQRVDEGAMNRGPVRPRRISTLLDDAAPTGVEKDGFAEFAAEVGATELLDLLEAAAAYMSFVEGRDQFSRPQLMNKVRQAETREFNREDGLRSFGQLLRDGKIEKTGGGRFTASGDIGFRPDGKRAAG